MKVKISASILEVDPLSYYQSIKIAVENGITLFHFDITDGIYAKRISFGDRLVSSILRSFNVTGELHLMVSRPELQIESFLNLDKVETIYFHPEASADPVKLVKTVKDNGKKAGIALNALSYFESALLSEVDSVLLLLVKPGEGGQRLNPSSLEAISELKRFREKRGMNYTISADGGIKPENAKDVAEAGAEMLVIGTGIFSGSIAENIEKLKESIQFI